MDKLFTSCLSSDLLIKGSANKKGKIKTNIEYFIEIENPKTKEYKQSLRIEYFLPISCPNEMSSTESPKRTPFGETSSMNKKPEGKRSNIETKRKLEEKDCLRINLEPIYIKIKLKTNK